MTEVHTPASTSSAPAVAPDVSASTIASAPVAEVEVFDPHPTFAYSGSLRPAYPLTKNVRVPASIVKPNYAREEVRQNFFAFWWDVSRHAAEPQDMNEPKS